MAHFLTGPPGGRTLPPTALKLTDLNGGVYGYGASLASTGPMALRPVIKAAQALKMGENWDEVIEYWRVSSILKLPIILSDPPLVSRRSRRHRSVLSTGEDLLSWWTI